MFEITDKIKDNIKDEAWPYLLRLNKRTSWNDASKDHLEELKVFLRSKNYISFVGHPNRYHLTRIGDSCLYDVPTFKKGVLTGFRGKRIRVVCVSSGRYDRLLMAGAVGVTPKNKIKIKEKNVHKDAEDPAEDDGEIRCPFCDTTDTCEHLLLVIDKTFRQAEGGVLYEAFNSRWSKIVEEADNPDFNEHEPFEDLLQVVDSISDAELTSSPDSAPGMSSTYSHFYCSSKKKTMAGLKKFSIT
jgi:hypothetical protein